MELTKLKNFSDGEFLTRKPFPNHIVENAEVLGVELENLAK